MNRRTPANSLEPTQFPRRFIFVLAIVILAFHPKSAAAREPIERRLLRTIQIGAPQDVTVAEIKHIAENPNGKYLDNILARSALLVLRQDDPKLVPYNELLDSVLNNLVPNSNAFPTLPALPDFRGKETVFTMVYALVMSGNQEQLTDILEKHLLTGGKYKQAIVISALRNIGTPRAVGLIQRYAESGQESNLAQTAIADEDYPILFEMHDRWNMIPPAARNRDNLRAIVQSGCDQRAAMAAYWLGFFASSIDPNKEVADLQALEAIVHKNTPNCEMMEHVIALKSLALRSPKSVAYWNRLARQTSNVWERHQVVINAWGRFGRKFAPAALDLLKTEPSQYIQWELLNGNLQTRQDYVYRDYWDIWIPVNILVPMEFPEGGHRSPQPMMDESDLNALLEWLESGARPKDPWVYNHMLYHLADFVSGNDTRRLLRFFSAHPERAKNYWIIEHLKDPSALPLLEYWSTLPTPPDQLEVLKSLIARLDNRSHAQSPTTRACCEATEICLLDHLTHAEPQSPIEIHSEKEAQAWLHSTSPAVSDFKIAYIDDSKRSATVTFKSGLDQHWEFIYDCWRRTDPTAPTSH